MPNSILLNNKGIDNNSDKLNLEFINEAMEALIINIKPLLVSPA